MENNCEWSAIVARFYWQQFEATAALTPEWAQAFSSTNKRAKIMGLFDYNTSEYIREATAAEIADSLSAAETDGGAGVISVDGRHCYVANSAF